MVYTWNGCNSTRQSLMVFCLSHPTCVTQKQVLRLLPLYVTTMKTIRPVFAWHGSGRQCLTMILYIWGVLRENRPLNRSLSLSYQKKDGRAWPHSSFFWYDTDFLEFESWLHRSYSLKVGVIPKEGWARPCTKTLRSVFRDTRHMTFPFQINIICGKTVLPEKHCLKQVWLMYWQGKVSRKCFSFSYFLTEFINHILKYLAPLLLIYCWINQILSM